MELSDENIVREVLAAMRSMGEGRASLELAAADCFRRLLDGSLSTATLAATRDPLQDDDEGTEAEPPRLNPPATNTGD